MSEVEIKQLPLTVANQIAAGEVVERPLSVIKELLENALDANASSIVIDIEKGGLALCRVRDNGVGIYKEQLPLAIAPHATSKIKSVDDLMQLHSLGFRGEALASISSVSRFKLISKPETQEDAAELSIDESGVPIISTAAHPKGTTIEVRDLFFNVPVRRTFLKSEKTEFIHIESVAKKIALSRFDLSIELTHNAKVSFKLPCAKSSKEIERRLSVLLGKPFMKSCVYFKEQNQALKLEGWLGSPDYMRSQSDLQYIFLNGRMVKDKLLMYAVRKVYEPHLYPGRAACFLLYFTLPPQEVDVNVHPTKHEVRFKEPRSIHDFFIGVLSKQLEEMVVTDSSDADLPMTKPDLDVDEGSVNSASSFEFENSSEKRSQHVSCLPATSVPYVDGDIIPLGSTHGLFLFQNKSYLFNVKVLYKKQLQQRLQQQFSSESSLNARPILVPLMVSLSRLEIETFPITELKLWGFDISQISADTLAIRTFPVITPHLDIQSFIQAVAYRKDKSIENLLTDNQELSLAQLSEQEQKSLIKFLIDNEQKSTLGDAYTCLLEAHWQEILNEK